MPSRWFERKRSKVELPDDPYEVLAFSYLRVSSKRQDKGFSPEAQQKEIAAYIRQHGWQVGQEFRDTLQGWRPDRPGYTALVSQVKAMRQHGRPVVVVAAHLDRTGRDGGEILNTDRDFRNLGVEWHYVRQGGTMDRTRTHVEGLVAELETEKLRTRVSRSKKIIASMGLPPSGPARWGYRWRYPQGADEVEEDRRRRAMLSQVNENKRVKQVRRILEPHPDEAPRVIELFQRAKDGASVLSLVEWAASLPDAECGGRRISQYNLKDTLLSPLYIGRYDYGHACATPEEVLALEKGQWPTLIDDDTWLAVQKRFPRTRRGRTPTKGRGYALANLIRCPKCLQHDSLRYMGGHGGAYRRYVCLSPSVGRRGAGQRCYAGVSADKVEAAVFDQVATVLDRVTDPALRADMVDAWNALNAAPDKSGGELRRLDRQIKRLVADLKDAFDRRHAMDDDEYAAIAEPTRKQLTSAKERRTRLEAQLVTQDPGRGLTLDEALRRAGSVGNTLRDPGVSPGARRDVLRELVDYVVPVMVGGFRSKLTQYTARIEWSNTGRILMKVADAAGPSASPTLVAVRPRVANQRLRVVK